MRIVLGLDWGGATLTRFDDRACGSGAVGEVAWGPAELLGDLELRLGLSAPVDPEAVRTAKWAERMALFAARERFYTRSFAVDPLGTARAVLKLRDLLIGAGWGGELIPGGGARLDALAELEAAASAPLPAGFADRIVQVERALAECHTRLYEEIALVEPLDVWQTAWRRVFEALERGGTLLHQDMVDLPGAPAHSDLSKAQMLLERGVSAAPVTFEGDGSLVIMTAETAWEAARATAALLASCPKQETVILRGHDASALDHALAVQGLARQGLSTTSPWRAALQILPLALELMFEPKDPYRVLELLTLAHGPFPGAPGHRLARALSESPGIGNPEWERAKEQIAQQADGAELVARIHEWLEQRGTPANTPAAKADLLTSVARVRAWILTRIAIAPEEATLLAAAQHAAALTAAIESDPRTQFSLIEVRRLAESIVSSGVRWSVAAEYTGRIDHVSSAHGLRVPRAHVVWWAFTDTEHSERALPWRRQELVALNAHGLQFPDPRARLDERAKAWRRVVRAATSRLILVVPHTSAGSALSMHPLWDELVGRVGEDRSQLPKVTLTIRQLLEAKSTDLVAPPPLEAVASASLPGGHAEWVVAGELAPIDKLSATSLDALLGCPLQWALRYRAGIRDRTRALPPPYLLNGQLGHRLIELLHTHGAFELKESELEQAAQRELDELIAREGAPLLRTGLGLERSQLYQQLLHAVLELSRVLRGANLRILAVEKPVRASFQGASLEGFIDLLVGASDGTTAIIDMKWGAKTYRELLHYGQASQLAVYAFAQREESGVSEWPEAAYFSLSRGRLLSLHSRLWMDTETCDGPSVEDTWRKVERTFGAIDSLHQRGRLPVAGVRRAPPLLEALGINDREQHHHFALPPKEACKYCDYKALCGQRWEKRA